MTTVTNARPERRQQGEGGSTRARESRHPRAGTSPPRGAPRHRSAIRAKSSAIRNDLSSARSSPAQRGEEIVTGGFREQLRELCRPSSPVASLGLDDELCERV